MKSVFWPFVEEEREMLAQKENYRRREASGTSGIDFIADLTSFLVLGASGKHWVLTVGGGTGYR